MLIYLDNCCFNRPYDDQTHVSIRIEAEAKLCIQDLVRSGNISCLWSFVLDFENSKNPFAERQAMIASWEHCCAKTVSAEDSILLKARELQGLGLKTMDAIHVASALAGNADYFITTDRGILKKDVPFIAIVSPITFMQIWENEYDY